LSVTVPSLTATPISLGWTRPSHFNSASTSRRISSSVGLTVSVAVAMLAPLSAALSSLRKPRYGRGPLAVALSPPQGEDKESASFEKPSMSRSH
jgi:hypothetical protein